MSDVAIKPLVYGVSDATKPQFKGLRNKKRTHRIFRILILVIFFQKGNVVALHRRPETLDRVDKRSLTNHQRV